MTKKESYDKFLIRVGYVKGKYHSNNVNELPNLKIENRPGVAALSNTIPAGGGFRKDIDEYRWKTTGTSEKPATIREIENKRNRLAPEYNKGAYQYITDGADPKTLGRKS
jgi:hypothetical protein